MGNNQDITTYANQPSFFVQAVQNLIEILWIGIPGGSKVIESGQFVRIVGEVRKPHAPIDYLYLSTARPERDG